MSRAASPKTMRPPAEPPVRWTAKKGRPKEVENWRGPGPNATQ